MSRYTSEEMAKILFPGGLPGTRLVPTELVELPAELKEDVARMEKKLNIRDDQINVRDADDFAGDTLNSYPAPIQGINVPPFPAVEVPDEATKAFIRELNREQEPKRESAHGFLEEGSKAMKHRASLRDAEDGERTAAQIAKVFNAITGHEISEADAWMFLICLKIVRSRNGKYNRDDYVDLAAYSGLLGECESAARKQ